ncbi:MAG: zinc ABC transporter substrate-binding protein ZnuA [Alphaproteobacteria bacterium]|nr:zinc ABC transporter substrate-binding protein ZnuA [Alphaproteobacteria bacterium]
MRIVKSLVVAAGIWCGGAGAALSAPEVVTSISPVHSLVAGVMQGVGSPKLLVKGGASPHDYALKPSDVRALRDADLIFWIGEDLETFLPKALKARGEKGRAVELFEVDGIQRWKLREGGAWDAHAHGDHGHGHGEHKHDAHKHDEHKHDAHKHDAHKHGDKKSSHDEHEEFDMHVWLDPANAKAMVAAIEAALVQADPKNAAAYRRNAKDMAKRLDALDKELRQNLAPVRTVPYIVFHDAYQSFEKRYGLKAVGSITISPEVKPGAKRLHEMRHKVMDQKAVCVFAEPQFEPALVRTIVRGTDARTGVLDPLGADLSPGKDAYFSLLRHLAKSLRDCLKPSS